MGGFYGGADYRDGREGGGEDATDPPGCWVDVVHPVAPEDWEIAVGSDYAVEEVDHDEEEGEDLFKELDRCVLAIKGSCETKVNLR